MAMAASPAAAAATPSSSFSFSPSHLSPFRPAVANSALPNPVVRRVWKPRTHFHSSYHSRAPGTHLAMCIFPISPRDEIQSKKSSQLLYRLLGVHSPGRKRVHVFGRTLFSGHSGNEFNKHERNVREQQCAYSGVFFLGRNSVQVRAQAEEAIEEPGPIGDEDICELVNGYEVGMGEAAISGYYIQALKNNNGAGVLVLTDVFGFRNNATRDFVLRLACFGYNVLIPDLFRENPWDENVPPTGEEFEAWRRSHTAENLTEDIDVASRWLKSALDEQEQGKKPPRYAILGFCIGGGLAIQTAAKSNAIETFSAAVSIYGSRIDLDVAKNIKMPLLLITGDQDKLSPVAVCEKIESMLQETKLLVYPGRGHGFAHRPDSTDDDDAAEDAFTALRTWLKEKLLLPAASASSSTN